jgi:NTP pyrophosphatase (non-canonical NTP hydrolase)
MSLQDSIHMMSGLYGPRNRFFLRGDTPALFLNTRIRDLWKAIRNGETDKDVLAQKLASVICRTVVVMDAFRGPPVAEALCEKFPLSGCAYCGKVPCVCEMKRTEGITLADVSEMQMAWSISDWIQHLGRLYGEKNKEAGIQFAMLRLMEEVFEAQDAFYYETMSDADMLLDARIQGLNREFADIFAWIFAIAHLLDLPLEEAVMKRYSGVCQWCKKRPCQCGSPIFHNRRANRNA